MSELCLFGGLSEIWRFITLGQVSQDWNLLPASGSSSSRIGNNHKIRNPVGNITVNAFWSGGLERNGSL